MKNSWHDTRFLDSGGVPVHREVISGRRYSGMATVTLQNNRPHGKCLCRLEFIPVIGQSREYHSTYPICNFGAFVRKESRRSRFCIITVRVCCTVTIGQPYLTCHIPVAELRCEGIGAENSFMLNLTNKFTVSCTQLLLKLHSSSNPHQIKVCWGWFVPLSPSDQLILLVYELSARCIFRVLHANFDCVMHMYFWARVVDVSTFP